MSNDFGGFCHFEIPTYNLELSKIFFSTVFDWEVNANEVYPEYWFFKGGDTCGAFVLSDVKHQHGINHYIKVTDIVNVLEKVKSNGGNIMKEKTLIDKDHGYYAEFIDNVGNFFSLWSKD